MKVWSYCYKVLNDNQLQSFSLNYSYKLFVFLEPVPQNVSVKLRYPQSIGILSSLSASYSIVVSKFIIGQRCTCTCMRYSGLVFSLPVVFLSLAHPYLMSTL